MLDLAAKQGLTPYPMLDNVIQSEVVDVASKQLVAAFGGTTSPQKALGEHEVRARRAAVRPQGLDRTSSDSRGAAAGGATLLAALPASSRSRRSAAAPAVFSLPVVVLVGALLLYPIGADRLLQLHAWDGLTATWRRDRDLLDACCESPDFHRCSRTTRCMRARDPGRDRRAARRRVPALSHLPAGASSASVFFLPTAVSWVVIGVRRDALLRRRRDPAALLDDVGLGIAASRHALARALGRCSP